MYLFKDVISGDEMFSDSFDPVLKDDFYWEVDGKVIVICSFSDLMHTLSTTLPVNTFTAHKKIMLPRRFSHSSPQLVSIGGAVEVNIGGNASADPDAEPEEGADDSATAKVWPLQPFFLYPHAAAIPRRESDLHCS